MHDGREEEANCSFEFRLHTRREVQFEFVSERDGLKCWDCGEAPEKWLRSPETFIGGRPGGETPSHRNPQMILVHGTRYTPVTRVTALELEHATPLWAVAHLPPEERRFYFGPENQRLRCPGCHGKKTKAEARDRAHMKRLEAGPKVSARKIPGRAFGPSRGFQKGPKRPIPSRPLRS